MLSRVCVCVATEMLSVWLIPFLLLLGETGFSFTHSGLSCVNDYIKTIWCVWNSSVWLTGRSCFIQVFRDTHRGLIIKNCSLNTRNCTINMSTSFHFAESLQLVVLCNGIPVDRLMNYRPGRHVKLHPPDQLNVSQNSMTWSRGPQFSRFITRYVFEVQIKAKQQSWEEVKARRVDGTSVLLNSVCEGECEARVRVMPMEPTNEEQIRGFWSDWSSVLCWRSKVIETTQESHTPKETESYTFNISHPAVVGTLAGFAVFILLISFSVHKHKCGLKMGCEHVPDPSKYFKPLGSEHKGNFQEWLSPRHSVPLFLPVQSCDCEISAVDEVCDVSNDTQLDMTNPIAALSDSSQLSSGVSNMGYFYSEHQPGSVCLDSCPIYFTYHPEGCAPQTSPPYERLRGAPPAHPDSGFGMETEKEEEADEVEAEDGAGKEQAQECSFVNMQHLVAFVVSLPDNARIAVPPSYAELTPWHEEPLGIGANSEATEGTGTRPMSMVVQPCNSGYLTLKEMQKYSNKSI